MAWAGVAYQSSGSRGYPYTLLARAAVSLGNIKKCISIPRDHLAMTGTKNPAHLVVTMWLSLYTFLKVFFFVFLKLKDRGMPSMLENQEEKVSASG